MISGVLTLFNWTLKMDSKSIYPHVIRAVFAFLMMFSIGAAFVNAFGNNSIGLRLFETICLFNVILITVSGISYFVTAVTEEKDAGTYALLRLAGMNSLSITLGKSTSRLVSSLMLLVIQLPFTFLSITLGGILWQQIVASYIALAAWMALVANLALFCSVRCATSGRAAGLAGTILGIFFFSPVIITNGLAALPAGLLSKSVTSFLESIPPALSSVSVMARLSELLGTSSFNGIPFSGGASGGNLPLGASGRELAFFGGQFWLSLIIAFVLFVFSTLTLDLWSAPAEVSGFSSNQKLRRWSVSRCWRLAIAWKEFLYFTGGRSFLITKMVCGGVLVAGFIFFQQLEGRFSGLTLQGENGWGLLLTLTGWLTIESLLYSSGCLFYEIRQSTQSTLATVPMSSTRVLAEKLAGCAMGLVPVLFWMLVAVLIGYASISDHCSATMVISYLIILSFSVHISVLLSLYTRWAALPLTILVSFPAFFCLAAPIYALAVTTEQIARSQHFRMSVLISALVNMFWTWLFILLPLQIWIRDRWNHVSEH